MERETHTVEVVERQLAAMGAERYEVGVKRADGRMVPLVLRPGAVLGRVAWLERENAGGADVFVRPAGSVGLVLVDDLDAAGLARMASDGLTPAVVVQTSPTPRGHQAWVRLSDVPIAPALASATARELAARYGGDPNSAAWRHYGRLAGFTNRKPKHRRSDGTYPVVALLATADGVAVAGADVLEAAWTRLATAPVGPRGEVDARLRVLPRPQDTADVSPLGQLYRREAARLAERYPALDASRLDWMIVLSLARTFTDADPAELARAMYEGSPGLTERKAGHVSDYVTRTVMKALGAAAQERADQ
jgi:hypothetical protein